MSNLIQDRTQSVGKFKLLLFRCIDLYPLLDNVSKEKVQNWRAHAAVYENLSKVLSQLEASAGTFYLTKQRQEPVHSRMKLSMERFAKSIFTPTFLEKAVPLLFEEREGQKLSDTAYNVRLGRKTSIEDIIPCKSPVDILYDNCELRIFSEGILSIRFQFSGEDVLIDDLISLAIELRQLTHNALSDKVRAIVTDWSNSSHPFSKLGIQFLDPQELFERSILVRRFSSGHAIILLESMKDDEGARIPIADLESQPGLLGVLRQTHRAISYKEQMLNLLKEYNLGYKSDEIYMTLRGTTLIVLPKHWDPHTYLSRYIDDLALFIEYYVSKITYLDILALIIEDVELNEPLDTTKVTSKLVNQIISLRKILILTDESLDVDLLVDHYFTRGVLIQLIEQRGIWNKLDSIKKRISNIDNILELIAQYNLSYMGLASSLRQVKIAIWALLATLVFSIISVILSLMGLLK